MTDANPIDDDADKLTDVLVDVTKRWFGTQDTVDARLIVRAYVKALGAFLVQIDERNRGVLVARACNVLVEVTGVSNDSAKN